MATPKQLAALAKARKARAAKIKAKKKPIAKKRSTVSRRITAAKTRKATPKRKATTRKASPKYFVYIAKNRVKYYLQRSGTRYIWDSVKPAGFTLATAQRLGMTEGKKALAKLPKTCAVYIEKK